ncbi:MAG: LuxR C-terminal-related transcriptional regulator [Aeromicrobium sp.]
MTPDSARRELVDSIGRITREVDDSRVLRKDVLERLGHSIAFDWYAWVLTDPVTSVGIDPLAEIPNPADIPIAVRLKYLTTTNRWTTLDSPAALGKNAADSRLWRGLQRNHGVVDVASVVLRDRYGCWGFLDLWSHEPFSTEDLSTLKQLTPVLTEAVRRNRAASFRAESGIGTPGSGPVVLLLDDELTILGQARGSDNWLQLLMPQSDGSRPVPACAFNVAAQLLAREAGVDGNEAMARMPLESGDWVTLRATRLEPDDRLAVTIERTTAADRLELFGLTHGLSRREQSVVGALATGADTAEVAARLHLSIYTVQDHLKAIFAKTATHSRGALLARATG